MHPKTGQVVIILIVLFVRLAAVALARVFRPLQSEIDQRLSESAATGEILGQQRQRA